MAPAAHYWMGGITTDALSRTTIAGLYAVGETASTGVHGANRLASNSLLECLVFGAQLRSLELSDAPTEPISEAHPERAALNKLERELEQLTQIRQWRQELPRLMWQSAGICREHRSLAAAITQVETWRQELMALPLSQTLTTLLTSPDRSPLPLSSSALIQALRLWGETRNLLDVAYLILKSAALRTESRGGHYRSDYPTVDPEWQVHTLVENQIWRRSNRVM